MKNKFMNIIGVALLALVAFPAVAGDASDVLAGVRKSVAPDGRQVVFDLKVDGNVLTGVTSEQSALDAAVRALEAAGIKVENQAKVYPYDNMGLVRIPVASLRTRSAHAGEMATQAVMGTPVRLLEHNDGWYRLQTPDGYIAYVPDSSIIPVDKDRYDAWRADDSRLVAVNLWQSHAWQSAAATSPREVVTDIVLGTIVEPVKDVAPESSRILVSLPDGRRGWVEKDEFVPVREWADQPFDVERILDTAYSLEGAPYLWGGTSIKSVDCSGLVKVSYLNNGLILRRDASQQALTGTRLEASEWPAYQAGDLMFFGNASTGRVTHVAIYDHDGMYVHSSGRVKRNSVDPESPDYLYSPLHAVRIHGNEGTDGIVRAIDHPWYFNK